jgi:hypothetical protein
MIWAVAIAGGLFLGMVLFQEVGLRIGRKQIARDGERVGAGAVEGAIFALLGLLVAFTFAGAAARFDDRRHLVTEEANAIGTAWLRLDLLPANAQPGLRDLFRRYLDSRLEAYRRLPDLDAASAELARSEALQRSIWSQAVAAGQTAGTTAPSMLLLPALNAMIDITTTRTMATEMHPPPVLFVMLALISWTAALLAGYGMAANAARSWIHMLAFAAATAVTVYVIIDMEYPRLGLIRVDAVDHVLSDLRRSMN